MEGSRFFNGSLLTWENFASVAGDLLGAFGGPWRAEDDGGHYSLPCDCDVGGDSLRYVAGLDGGVVNRRTSRGRFPGYAGLFGLAQLIDKWCVTERFPCGANQRRGYRCAGANQRGQFNRVHPLQLE